MNKNGGEKMKHPHEHPRHEPTHHEIMKKLDRIEELLRRLTE